MSLFVHKLSQSHKLSPNSNLGFNPNIRSARKQLIHTQVKIFSKSIARPLNDSINQSFSYSVTQSIELTFHSFISRIYTTPFKRPTQRHSQPSHF